MAAIDKIEINLEWKPGMTLEEIKVAAILACLRLNAGNKVRTAKALEVSVRTIRNYVSRHSALAEYRGAHGITAQEA